jgi:hypothetical protein
MLGLLVRWATSPSSDRRSVFGLGAMLLAVALFAVLFAVGALWNRAREQYWHRYYTRMQQHWLDEADRADRDHLHVAAVRARELATYNAERQLENQR